MNKTELLSTYTAEQLAEMVINLQNDLKLKVSKSIVSEDGEALKVRCDKCGEEFIALMDDRYILCTKAEFYATQDANRQLNQDVARLKKKHNRALKEWMGKQEEIRKLNEDVQLYKTAHEKGKIVWDSQICEYQEKIYHLESRTLIDFFPSEPIKVADMLISATYTRQKGDMEKALHKAFGNNSDTVTENVYSKSELRQIAEHLLVYCNHNEGEEE